MHQISHIDFANINLTPPQALNDKLTLSNINYPKQRLGKISMHGTVQTEPKEGTSDEFEEPISFWFSPDDEDMVQLEKLDEIFNTENDHATRLGKQLGFEVSQYNYKSVFNQKAFVRMKMKLDDKDNWKFHANQKFTKDNMTEFVKPYVPLTVAVNMGFYFSVNKNNEKNFGLYLSLQDLLLDQVAPASTQGGEQPSKALTDFLAENEHVRKTSLPKRNARKVLQPV